MGMDRQVTGHGSYSMAIKNLPNLKKFCPRECVTVIKICRILCIKWIQLRLLFILVNSQFESAVRNLWASKKSVSPTDRQLLHSSALRRFVFFFFLFFFFFFFFNPSQSSYCISLLLPRTCTCKYTRHPIQLSVCLRPTSRDVAVL